MDSKQIHLVIIDIAIRYTQGMIPLLRSTRREGCLLYIQEQWLSLVPLLAFAKLVNIVKGKFFSIELLKSWGGRIPDSVLQEELQNPTAQQAIRGTTKAAILEGYPCCPKLIASSVYDTKTVH